MNKNPQPDLRGIETKPLLFALVVTWILMAYSWPSDAYLDYVAFYSAGRVAMHSPSEVYSVQSQRQAQQEVSGTKAFAPFFHAPHELTLFGPLSLLTYRTSLWIWRLLNLAALIAGCYMMARIFSRPPLEVILIGAGFLPSVHSLFAGQDGTLLFFLLCYSLYLAHKQQEAIAGVVLALALFKPQIPLVIAFAMLVGARFRFVAWFSAAASLITLISVGFVGRRGVSDFMLILAATQAAMGDVATMPNLRGVFALLSPHHQDIAIPVSLAIVAGCAAVWVRLRDLAAVFSLAILAGGLVSLHLHMYDMSFVLIPGCLLLYRVVTDHTDRARAVLYSTPVFALASAGQIIPLLALVVGVLGFFVIRTNRSAGGVSTV